MSDQLTKSHPSEPRRSRAIFSSEDFRLLQAAVAHFLEEIKDKPEAVKYSNLYHRLGRIT